jgi:hypothetical protein
MNGVPRSIGHATHSAQNCNPRPGGTTVALVVFVITVMPPTSTAVKVRATVSPLLKHEGIEVESVFVTESSPNTFTRLPVREGEHFLVWFGTLRRGSGPSAKRLQRAGAVLGMLAQGPMEILQLDPTPRSLHGHHRGVR